MLPLVLYSFSLIEQELLNHLVFTDDKTFSIIEGLLDGIILYEKGERKDLVEKLSAKSNCYFYYLLWVMRNNRDLRNLWKVYRNKFNNIRFRFVVLDITTHSFILPDGSSEVDFISETVIFKDQFWHQSFDQAFRKAMDYDFGGISQSEEEEGTVKRMTFVEGLCTCQLPTCILEDMIYQGACIHENSHKRAFPIPLYSGGIYEYSVISFIDDCSRIKKNKRTLVFNGSRPGLRFKRRRMFAYFIPRSDIWYYSEYPVINSSFENWNFGSDGVTPQKYC